MNFQPPDAPDHGHCLRCKRFVIEAEQKSGICIDCQDGGSAFPVSGSEHGYPVAGMSLRDYFAAKAMQGMFANDALISRYGQASIENLIDPDVMAATAAYSIADAMLAARSA